MPSVHQGRPGATAGDVAREGPQWPCRGDGARRETSAKERMRFCTHCGQLRGRMAFCTHCGQPTPRASEDEETGASGEVSSAVEGPPPSNEQSSARGGDRVWQPVPGRAASYPVATTDTSGLAPQAGGDRSYLPPGTRPDGRSPRAGGRIVRTLAMLTVVIVLAAGAFATWWFVLDPRGSDDLRADASTSAEHTPRADPTTEPSPTDETSAPSATTTSPSTQSTSPPTTPTPLTMTPESALTLSTAKATRMLDGLVVRDRRAAAGLAGSWVPQVSSKCTGLDVDLEPDFTPDGISETPDVTVQQILAFHVALQNRYQAITTTADELGVDPPTSGGCVGKVLWVALVSQQFATGESANAWCDRMGIDVDECLARKVVPPGEGGTEILSRQ